MSDPVLHLDFETFSECELRSAGAYAYAMHPSTDILCAAWRIGDGPVQLWLPGQPVPFDLVGLGTGVRVIAHNSGFERLIWKYVACKKYGWPAVPDEAFWCTAAQAANLGLPRDLEGVGIALGATVQKDPTGRRVMLKLAKPRKPTKNDPRTRWTPEMAPEDFAHLYRYCVQDVEAEDSIGARMRPLADRERRLFLLDQKINDRGVKIDRTLIDAALRIVEQEQDRLNREMARATGGAVTACTQTARLIEWVEAQNVAVPTVVRKGKESASLAKHIVEGLLKDDAEAADIDSITDLIGEEDESAPIGHNGGPDLDERVLPPEVRVALELRREAAKSSTAKLRAMLKAAGPDDRIRGSLLYCGASRTKRWSGRLHQPQNFTRGDEDIVAQVNSVVTALLAADADTIRLLYGAPLDVIASTLRPCMVAEEGHDLMCPDFSNVEGRGLAWMADEEWKLQAFRDFDAGVGEDLYKVGAGRILGRPPETITKKERQEQGKIPELACGYQGWIGAFHTFAKLYGFHVSDDEAARIAGAWRDAHPATKNFWYALNRAALRAVANPGRAFDAGPITYKAAEGWLWCRLPSGGVLAYASPSIEKNDRGEDAVHYWGVPNPTKPIIAGTRRWAKLSAYGGLFAENCTQAMCRDLLAEAMLRLDANGYPIALTVHDEIVIEAPHGFGSPEEVRQIVSEVPAWAQGMPISVGKFGRQKRYSK